MNYGFSQRLLPDFEYIFQQNDFGFMLPEPADEVFRLAAVKAFAQGRFRQALGCQDFGAEGLNASFAHAHLADDIHQLGDEPIIDEGGAKRLQAVARRKHHFRVVDRVPKIKFLGNF